MVELGYLAVSLLIVLGCAFFLGRKRETVEQKAARSEKELRQAQDNTFRSLHDETSQPELPEIEPVPLQGRMADSPPALEQLLLDAALGIELTRVTKEHKRVTVIKGVASIRPDKLGRIPTLFFFVWNNMNYYIDGSKIMLVKETTGNILSRGVKESYKLVYDILYSEPLNPDGTIDWSDDLEVILADSGMDQYITVATFEAGFQLTPQVIRIMEIVGGLAFLFGLALNGALHIVPTTEIHWVP